MIWLVLLVLLVFSLSWFGTRVVRGYALRHSIMDVPNLRSSHSLPTPRGGGVSIVLSFLAVLPVLMVAGLIEANQAFALLGAGALVAMVGALDDRGHIPARWRLLIHFLSAAWGLYWLGGLPALRVGESDWELGRLGMPLGLLYLVWMLNLYNFMDGIDGIAAVEAITACLGIGLICSLIGDWQLALLPVLLAAAVGGFLCWNFPPAKIFMGDAGSGFLGLILGLLSLLMAWQYPQLLVSWLILLGVFWVDATMTLLRRLLRGERVYEAHRSHAYQFAARVFGRHLPVTLAVGAINILWLLPLAAWAALYGDTILMLVVAYVPLIGLAIKYRAGLVE